MANQTQNKSYPFQQVKEALLDINKPFPPKYLHGFSDISAEDLAELMKIWDRVQPNRRVAIMEDLEELEESDTLVCFDDLSKFVLGDDDPRARAIAIRLLWECDDQKLHLPFIDMLENDPEEIVRSAAASGLGSFISRGELNEVKPEIHRKVEDTLLKCLDGQDTILVRRRCLESLGFSSSKKIHSYIEEAYESDDTRWQVSALCAMGRSADNRWQNAVVNKLYDEDEEVRFEAVRAAGELSLSKARQPIVKLLKRADELEDDLRLAAIWSLSQIGGEKIRHFLEKIQEECEDDDEIDFIEQAMDNLDFNQGMVISGLFEVDEVNEDDMYEVIDISDEESDPDGDDEDS